MTHMRFRESLVGVHPSFLLEEFKFGSGFAVLGRISQYSFSVSTI